MNLPIDETNLSSSEKKLLKKLLKKITPVKKKRQMNKPTFCVGPTFLRMTVSCLLCKTVTVEYAKMLGNQMVGMQRSKPDEFEEGNDTKIHSCPCCVQKLMDTPKDKLVGILLHTQHQKYTQNIRR